MAVFLYNIFLLLFRASLRLASPFNAKAKKWVQGRQNIFKKLEDSVGGQEAVVWIHCASVGEFEQGKTVMEALRQRFPASKILLTFFSPSGYEAGKNYPIADWVFYLPIDGPVNAKRFLEIVRPQLVIFVKYELWYYYLKKIKYRNIPLILISALFRKDMGFFKWYGGLQRKMLSRFNHLFVQNSESKQLLDAIGLQSICSISGDTRFDRVAAIARNWEPIYEVGIFLGDDRAIVAGSTWEDDEEILRKTMLQLEDPAIRLILAPHEIREDHLSAIEKLFPDSIRFSAITRNGPQQLKQRVLLIDNIGYLSRLYNYGFVAYVGGGFRNSGIHNVLEPAVFNKVVLFGPNYQKYKEAVGLVLSGGGISFPNHKKRPELLAELIKALNPGTEEYRFRSKAAGDYVKQNEGATERILQYIQENRLLTN